jgi:hypothetical protein
MSCTAGRKKEERRLAGLSWTMRKGWFEQGQDSIWAKERKFDLERIELMK